MILPFFLCLTNVVHETEARPARSLTPNSWKALTPWVREIFQTLLRLGSKQSHTVWQAVASRAEHEGIIKLCWNADRQLPRQTIVGLSKSPWHWGRAQAAAEIVGTLFANQQAQEVPWHDMQVFNLRHCCAWTPGFLWCRDRLELGLMSYLIHLNTKFVCQDSSATPREVLNSPSVNAATWQLNWVRMSSFHEIRKR